MITRLRLLTLYCACAILRVFARVTAYRDPHTVMDGVSGEPRPESLPGFHFDLLERPQSGIDGDRLYTAANRILWAFLVGMIVAQVVIHLLRAIGGMR